MKTTCKVKKLYFNDGHSLEVSPKDIVVFVGANNCGKSQSLKDINQAFANPEHNIVIKRIEYQIYGREFFTESLKKVSSFNNRNNQYGGYGYSIHSGWIGNLGDNTFNGMDQLARFFVKHIDTRDRLNQCDPVGVIDRDEPKGHPLHYLANDSIIRKKIDQSFHEAFGEHLQVERFGGRNNFLRIGEPVVRLANPESTVDEDVDHLTHVLDTYPKLHEQGDGMVGFTGVLLSLLIENFSIFLMDEPESFLHPPQARILGTEMPGLLGDRQAFIATHSEHLIKGLLEAAPDRIKVVRISRRGNNNSFSAISTEDIDKIWKDTLLRQSNVFQGLFYDAVVICESDSDCQFYSSVQAYQKERDGKRDNPFYVYSSTKSRMKVIVDALKPLNVEFRVIADMDLLREKNDLMPLYESCGGNWAELNEDFNLFTEALRDDRNTISKEDLKRAFVDAIDRDGKAEYDKTALKELKQKVTLEKKWGELKKHGETALPVEAKASYERIHAALIAHKIHLVPKGELEGFINVGNHGPKWVANVFEQHPDLSDAVYEDAKKFIGEWGI